MHLKPVPGGCQPTAAQRAITNKAGLAIVPGQTHKTVNREDSTAVDPAIEDETVLFRPRLTWVSET